MMPIFFNNKQNLTFFFILLLISSASVNSMYAYGQNSTQKSLGLFGNGNNSVLNDVFNKVKDSVVQIATEYKSADSSN